jgi:hypothetical protein
MGGRDKQGIGFSGGVVTLAAHRLRPGLRARRAAQVEGALKAAL